MSVRLECRENLSLGPFTIFFLAIIYKAAVVMERHSEIGIMGWGAG